MKTSQNFHGVNGHGMICSLHRVQDETEQADELDFKSEILIWKVLVKVCPKEYSR